MTAPIDQAQRLAALDPLQSACVTAPAGSGKTELLSQRVLTLLARVDKPEEILAITFTRKAAAEMHHRIIQALLFARDNDQPQEEYKQLTWRLARAALDRDEACDWNLLVNTGRLKVQTIDSLCASLTKQMPLLASFGAQPQVTNNADDMYQRAVASLLKQLESDSELANHIETLLRHVDNDWSKAERLLIDLLRSRDQWLFHIFIQRHDDPRVSLENSLQAVVKDHLQGLRLNLMPYSPELIPLFDYAGVCLRAEHSDSPITQLAGLVELPGCETAEDLQQWLAISDCLLTASGSFRKAVNKKSGFPTQTIDGDKKLAKHHKESMLNLIGLLHEQADIETPLHEVRYLPALHFADHQWLILEALTKLLPHLVAELFMEFQQQGEVDHSQIALAALQSLGDALNPTELRLRLDYRLKHILIDEFQDTASTQFELLKRLLEGWQEYNQEHSDSPNTLFIVGDGMQSIYGFREANVGLFLEARRQGVNHVALNDLSLKVNFRSSPTVIDWVNNTFVNAFPRDENLSRGAVKYESSNAYKPVCDLSEVKAFGMLGDDVKEQEADKVVELVQQSMANKPGASIAILVRTRSHLNDILPALAGAGIEWQATDINPLSRNAVIIDLLSLTKALINTADRVAWAAVLRSPFVGLDNHDLLLLMGSKNRRVPVLTALNDNEIFQQLSRFGQLKVESLRECVNAALSQRLRQSLRVMVQGVWLSLGGAACVNCSSEYASVDDYLNLLEQYELCGQLPSLNRFEEAVQRLYAAPQANDSCLQVMTIHKSKGLEFDTVILPALDRRPRSDDRSLLMWREYLASNGETHLVMSPLSAVTKNDAIYDYLRYQQDESRKLENTRLLYVAATRAINNLYMTFGQAKVYEVDSVKVPSRQSLLNCVWTTLAEEVVWSLKQNTSDDDQLSMSFDSPKHEDKVKRLSDHWRAPSWSFANPLADYFITQQAADAEDNVPDFEEDFFPRQLGNISHSILEQCVNAGVGFVSNMSDDAKILWLRRLCHAEGVEKDRWGDVNVFIDNMMTNITDDPKAHWLLSSEHQRSDVEYELLCSNEFGVSKRIIDRSFIDELGVRWIVDYKTSSPAAGEDLTTFLTKQCEIYTPQLREYKVLMALLNQDAAVQPVIKTALYFPAIPYWQEVVV